MKKILFLFVLCSQFMNAIEVGSFEEAQKLALGTNKIIVVDFWATWCGPCIRMDFNTWNDERVKSAMNDFIFVKIDIDKNRELANKYNVKSIPNIFFLDGNGFSIHNILGYKTPNEIIKYLENYNISTEIISIELINQYKKPNYYNLLKLISKYYDFTLYADNDLKGDLLHVCSLYLDESNNYLSKKEENYVKKKQKIELIKLFTLAYNFNFDKLDKKISEIKIAEIDESNYFDYWFLKYISTKALGKETSVMEEQLKNNELENVITDSNKLYAFYLKSKEKKTIE